MSDRQKGHSKKHTGKDRAAEVANILSELIITFALVLVVRAFVMEAFRIPTGSMASTLKGAHFRLRCPQCGYGYDRGFLPHEYSRPQDTIPSNAVPPPPTRCPSCGNYPRSGRERTTSVSNGDRILVLKCMYQFLEPKRWDVIVFKNPLEPPINYIKRLVGLPNEKIEIIDGDVYIDGKISRKPPKVQNELWMPVYDNDFRPVRPNQRSFNQKKSWQQPFRNVAGSAWGTDEANPTAFGLNSSVDKINAMVYDSQLANDFKATYAYDNVGDYKYMPNCSDLMLRLYARQTNRKGIVGMELSKYETHYRASVNWAGEMVIEAVKDSDVMTLARKSIEAPALNEPILVKFANVDHQLIFQFGREKLTHDLGRLPADAERQPTDVEPEVRIFGSGELTLSHVAIFRDIHYTTGKYANSGEAGRATEENPFKLKKDQFFVLGDNSPNSQDGRWWSREGIGNNGEMFAAGVVPRQYLVGKALFVYWPSGFKPFKTFPFAIVPNVGKMRFIYGGSNKQQ